MLQIIGRKLVGLVRGIVGIFRRLMCFLHLVRRRKNSGMLLPMTGDQRTFVDSLHSRDALQGEFQQSLPSNDVEELQSWDAWDVQGFIGPGNSAVPSSQFIDQTAAQSNSLAPNGNQYDRFLANRQNSQEDTPEPDIDFFQDMKPSLRKSAKITIKKREEPRVSGLSSRLAMTSEIPLQAGSELGAWEEGGESAWAEESLEDLSVQAQLALKERRHLEREQRLNEHQRRKLEKDSQRMPRRDGQLTAIKLS